MVNGANRRPGMEAGARLAEMRTIPPVVDALTGPQSRPI
jgi:hypothetical protein